MAEDRASFVRTTHGADGASDVMQIWLIHYNVQMRGRLEMERDCVRGTIGLQWWDIDGAER